MPAALVDEIPGVVLAIFAHPDDAEVAAGGTLARWASNGSQVYVCVCALGDKGSLDPSTTPELLVELRKEESAEAGKILGLKGRYWLGYPDGEIENSVPLRAQMVGLIRKLKPEVVLAPDPTAVFFGKTYVNHRDHRGVGWAVVDSVCPAASSPHYFPEEGPAHSVSKLLLAGTLEPDVWVDVGVSIEAKAAAVACHKSQIGERRDLVAASVRRRASDAGQRAGTRFAESFREVVLW